MSAIGIPRLSLRGLGFRPEAWNLRRGAMNIPPGLGDALLNSASDAIVATDREGRVRLWNPGAGRIFGFTAAEAVGQSLDLIIPQNLQARHWEGFHRTMETGISRYGHGDLLSVPGL